MTVLPLYPDGKDRCLTFSYDDGQKFDIRLAQIFNEHNLKATFNLNTVMEGVPVVQPEQYQSVYLDHGHEIACHTFSHPFMERMPLEAMMDQIRENRRQLEAIAKRPVKGMAYPFGTWSQEEQSLLRAAGIVYSRTVRATNDFHLPQNWMEWHPTCHHNTDALFDLAGKFLKNRWATGTLFYVWGHSFNFDADNNWDVIEAFADRMADLPNVWYATNMQIYDYVNAYRSLQFTQDCTLVFNPSALKIWIRTDHGEFEIPSGELVSLA